MHDPHVPRTQLGTGLLLRAVQLPGLKQQRHQTRANFYAATTAHSPHGTEIPTRTGRTADIIVTDVPTHTSRRTKLDADSEDLLERLTYTLASSEKTKISWIVGSGISHNIPGTKRMCEIMRGELGEPASERSTPEEYRRLSERLKKRRGNPGVLSLLRAMVAEAYRGPLPEINNSEESLNSMTADDNWSTSETHDAIAKIVSLIPLDRRGPIFTTNFDTLLETALCRNGVACHSVSQPHNTPVGIVGQHLLPVLHLHGTWNDPSSLNTDSELAWKRDNLEAQISQSLDETLLVAVGYGGWDDSFSRTVTELLNYGSSNQSLELVWISHRAHPQTGLLGKLQGNPNVTAYISTIPEISDHFRIQLSDKTRPKVSLPAGLRLIWPASISAREPNLDHFIDGSHPELEASNSAPRLKAAGSIAECASRIAHAGIDGVTVLTGPLGDGKTVSLQQAAIDLASSTPSPAIEVPGSTIVVEIERAAPVPPVDFWVGIRENFQTTFVVIDEADLIIDTLVYRIRASRIKREEGGPRDSTLSGSIVIIGAMHEQFRQTCRNLRAQEKEEWHLLRTDTLSLLSIKSLMEFWSGNGLIPPSSDSNGPASAAEIAPHLSTDADENSSLFGLLLTLWPGDSFDSRLRDIRSRLSRSMIGNVSSIDVLDAIAIIHANSPSPAGGATLQFIAELTGLRSVDIARTVIRPLGREAAISRIGNRVVIRHKAIAEHLVKVIPEDRYAEMCDRISRVGGQMRRDNIAGHECASLLCRDLPYPLSKSAARSAFRASGLLESRVTYLKVLRKGGALNEALAYAAGLRENYREFPDWEKSWRGLFIELSVCYRLSGAGESAVRHSLLALSSLEDTGLDTKNLEFGLVNTILASRIYDTHESAELGELSSEILGLAPRGSYASELSTQNYDLSSGELSKRFIALAQPLLRPVAPAFHGFLALVLQSPDRSRSHPTRRGPAR